MTYATVRRAVSELSVSIYSQSTASERRINGSKIILIIINNDNNNRMIHLIYGLKSDSILSSSRNLSVINVVFKFYG